MQPTTTVATDTPVQSPTATVTPPLPPTSTDTWLPSGRAAGGGGTGSDGPGFVAAGGVVGVGGSASGGADAGGAEGIASLPGVDDVGTARRLSRFPPVLAEDAVVPVAPRSAATTSGASGRALAVVDARGCGERRHRG